MFTRVVSGWGNYPKQEARIASPSSCSALQDLIAQEESLLARGMGRSYGDSADA